MKNSGPGNFPVRETKYGFQFGPAIVERVCSDPKGGVVIQIRSGKQGAEVRVTPSGIVRVGVARRTTMKGVPFEEAFNDKGENR